MTPTYRAPTDDDLRWIADRLSKEDLAEITASDGGDPYEILKESVKASVAALVGVINGEPACVLGLSVVEGMPDTGAPWMLASPLIQRYPRVLMHESRRWIEWMHTHCRVLFNYVDVRHARARRWLIRLGFENVLIVPKFGAAGRPFILYRRTAADV